MKKLLKKIIMYGKYIKPIQKVGYREGNWVITQVNIDEDGERGNFKIVNQVDMETLYAIYDNKWSVSVSKFRVTIQDSNYKKLLKKLDKKYNVD